MVSRKGEFLIGAVSKITGVNAETIRYYEKIGLLRPPARARNRYRCYVRDDIERLIFIRKCRELGYSLEQTSSLLALADSENLTCREVNLIAQSRLGDVRAKIADLRSMEAVLERFLAACPGDTGSECPIIAALSDGRWWHRPEHSSAPLFRPGKR